MSNNENQFTLEEITASWLGHGKQIPIGQMMAWLIKAVGDLQPAAAKWWQVYQDQCEGAYIEATIVKELKADVKTLKESAENWKLADREKFDKIAELRKTLAAASHALRSYQYGNARPELAASVALACDDAIKGS